MDKRWHQLADILVNYSTSVQPGERVMIAMKETASLPLVRAVYEATIKAGGYPQVQYLSDDLWHAGLRYGTPEQAAWVPEIEAYGMEWADVYFGLRAAHNPHQLAGIDAPTLAAHRQAMGKISSMRWQQTRWCLVPVPTQALAQQARADLETMLEMFFDACLQDWPAVSAEWRTIALQLSRGSHIRLVGKETDLRFSTEGRTWEVGDGRFNMPDGEIWTAPVSSSVNGHIHFEFPGVLGGRLVEDIRLEWQDGRLVTASASSNEDFLQQIVNIDAGASLLGEFAVGTNYGIDLFSSEILLDEKIGGTVHVALGRAYPQAGGTSESAIHWDIIKDTRREGTIYLDGRKVWENGHFSIA